MNRTALAAAAFAATLALTGPAVARAEVPHLTLEPNAQKTLSATLLDQRAPSVPGVMEGIYAGDLQMAAYDNLVSFEHDYDALAPDLGGGDDSGGLALIAGILGFFPGFGIGHLITGNISGFLLFLVIDLVIAGVFFVLFPLLAFSFWYVPSVIVIIIERVVEAFSAANSATRGHYAELLPGSGEPADRPVAVSAALQVLSF